MTGEDRASAETVTVKTWWGQFQVPAAGFAAQFVDPARLAREQAELVESGSMRLSIGKFPDLLWMLVPEARDIVAEAVKEELDDALRHGRFLMGLSDYALADTLRDDLVVPAMLDVESNRDLLVRVLAVLRRLILGESGSYFWELFDHEVVRRLEGQGHRVALDGLDPALMVMLDDIRASRR